MNRSLFRCFRPHSALRAVLLLVLGTGTALLPQAPALGRLAEPSVNSTAVVRVGLQVGHWKEAQLPAPLARLRGDTGAQGGGRTEVDLNMDLATRTAQKLRVTGVQVDILPATVPTGYRANAFVAIHADGNPNVGARGYKIATRWRSNVAYRDETLAEMLGQAYSDATGLPHDYAVTRNMRGYYAINTWFGDESRISDYTPAAIIETGYMTNIQDRRVLFGQTDTVATGIARGILRFLDHGGVADAVQKQAETVAAASPTRRSVVVIQGNTPIKVLNNSGSPTIRWAGYGESLFYLDNTVRPKGPFTNLHGTELAQNSGYLRIGISGLSFPVYISRDAVIVQQPAP
ncbi:MAG: N-acetylmuramoyl-L-alanine amidase [Chloroflexia bacterium]